MAEDESRFGRMSLPRRAWAPPGVRPCAPHQIVREYTHVYAAVAPAEGKMTSLILPSADTEMMNLFLEHVSKTFEKYFVVMQVDRAGWHHSKDLQVPANIRLIAQPAYSPERESSSNMSGKKYAKNIWRIWLWPLSMR
jgi:DDE superfamily endonuclease